MPQTQPPRDERSPDPKGTGKREYHAPTLAALGSMAALTDTQPPVTPTGVDGGSSGTDIYTNS